MMIVTFTKLFPIRMVANKRCGFSSKFKMFRSDFALLFSISFNDCGLSEKKATSDAEMMAETNKSNKLINKAIIPDKVTGETEIPAKP